MANGGLNWSTQHYNLISKRWSVGNGYPTIANPSGGTGTSSVKLDLKNTQSLITEIENISGFHKKLTKEIPSYISNREESLVFYPTRVTAHAGDPYVGMVGYYDIAFTRSGESTRERFYNLVAYAKDVSINEITDVIDVFNKNKCPFSSPLLPKNSKSYNYHLRNSCKETKTKPARIYSELADIIIFKDGGLFNAG